MTLLNAHDWRLDSTDDGTARVHKRPRADRPELTEDCVHFRCERCGTDMLMPKTGPRQPPKYGCQG